MKKHYIDIVKKWAFIFAYDIGEDDVEEVGDWLEALGASRREIAHATDVIMGTNKGLTYSNTDLRMSVICVSHASSRAQWWDTLVHEIHHIVNTIINYYGVDYESEEAAYLQGYVMRKIIEVL